MKSLILNKGLRVLATKLLPESVYFPLRYRVGTRVATRAVKAIPTDLTSEELIARCFEDPALATIRPFQVREEITALVKMVEELRPRKVLEVGTANGGTLFLLARVSDPSATILSLDLPYDSHEGNVSWKADLFRSFALPGQTVDPLLVNSQAEETAAMVKGRLGEVDVAFIDGDHSPEGVRRDFSLYAPMVRKGGLIAFHDIIPNVKHPEFGVVDFWEEIKGNYEHVEFVHDRGQGEMGIGVLKV